MTTKKDEPSPTQQKIPSKKEEPKSQVQQKMPSKKDEPSQAQQKMPNKKEEQSQAERASSKKEEPSQGYQGDGAAAPGQFSPHGPSDHLHSRAGNSVLKTGALFLSSKGIGWTTWKKRWFILTNTSLVFFRSDPNVVSQKGDEANLTLGGIDLNNSGSVVVKADKKLITVLFHDGRERRNFTLKAETLEDLYEWKAALEDALSQAPSSAHVMGQNGIFGNDKADAVDGPKESVNDKQPVRSTVIGRPILLALEDVDGSPTFLEKALRFVEQHGIKVEGILRQAADVELVKRRIQEYEQGKTEFSSSEDPHVIADCVKYVIRELPSSPVPASCCNALLEACRTERGGRVNAMRMAVLDTFPEPNRRLLQRILIMMQTVASKKNENLMSSSAVSACMAPLLLRPLLSGDCHIENDFDVGGDGSFQLLQAAAAANHAQAIVITLLEEYDKIFGEGSVSPDLYSDTDESGSESEEATDDDEYYEDDDDYDDDEYDDETQESDAYDDDDYVSSGTGSESGHSDKNDLDDDKDSDYSSSGSESSVSGDDLKATKKISSSLHSSQSENDDSERSEDNQSSNCSEIEANKCTELSKGVQGVTKLENKLTSDNQISCISKSTPIENGSGHHVRRSTLWGRTAGRKNLPMESIDFTCEEETEIERLEAEKSDLQTRLTKEIEGNSILEASLEKRKKTLHEHRLALEKDVARLKEELQRERDKRMALESGLNSSQVPLYLPDTIDEKTKADLKDIAQAEEDIINLNKTVDDLEMQLNQQVEQNSVSTNDSRSRPNHQAKMKDKPKGSEAAFERSGSKEKYADKIECKIEKKQESSSVNKFPPQNQQLDHSAHNSNRMHAAETVAQKALAPSNLKKSAMKGEWANTVVQGANSATSAVTKLTNRLNFIKELRNQIANEIQGTEKGRRSSQAVPGEGPEPIQSVQNPEKGRGPDVGQ